MNTGDPFRFSAIGAGWQIDSECALPEDLRQQICSLAEEFDQVWSRFRADSLITRIAHAEGGGQFEFPIRDVALFELYNRLVAATDGAVDPLVGRDLEMLGYDARYSLAPDKAAIARRRGWDTWRSDIRRDATTIITDRPVVIDVGAAGKGYLVDLIADTLLDAGIDRFLVNGSGDYDIAETSQSLWDWSTPPCPGGSSAPSLCRMRHCARRRRTGGPGVKDCTTSSTAGPAAPHPMSSRPGRSPRTPPPQTG
jgi:thiamine biosynthesis lipoprotein